MNSTREKGWKLQKSRIKKDKEVVKEFTRIAKITGNNKDEKHRERQYMLSGVK